MSVLEILGAIFLALIVTFAALWASGMITITTESEGD